MATDGTLDLIAMFDFTLDIAGTTYTLALQDKSSAEYTKIKEEIEKTFKSGIDTTVADVNAALSEFKIELVAKTARKRRADEETTPDNSDNHRQRRSTSTTKESVIYL